MMKKPNCPIIAIEEHYWDPELAKHFTGPEAGRGSETDERLYDLGSLRLKEMDEAGIDIQVLSHGAPSTQKLGADIAAELTRDVNNRLAKVYYQDYAKDFPLVVRPAWGYTVETATQAIRLVLSGVFDAHPNLKVILGHFGETLPFLVWRIDTSLKRPGQKAMSFRDIFCKNFYVTTSGFFSDPALICCMLEMGVDHILFAVDWPFVMNPPAVKWMEGVSISDSDKVKILSGNAKRLLKM